MPSLQQLRWEAFADAVEHARRSRILRFFGGHHAHEYVDVRVETEGGVSVECRLMEVDLDRQVLVGRALSGPNTVVLPLSRVRAVWHMRRRMGRALLLWLAVLLSGAAVGALLAPPPIGAIAMSGPVIGALLGAFAGLGVLFLTDGWAALYELIPMYDSTQPS